MKLCDKKRLNELGKEKVNKYLSFVLSYGTRRPPICPIQTN